MTAEQLYQLIKNLSSEDKGKISLALNSFKKGRKPAYVVLFERLSILDTWSADNEKRLRNPEFNRHDFYYQMRETLLDKILRILTNSEEAFSKEYIKKAIALDALGLARKVLQKALDECLRVEDFLGALSILQLDEVNYEKYRFRLLSYLSITFVEIERLAKIDLTLKTIRSAIDKVKIVNAVDRIHLANNLLTRIRELNSNARLQSLRISSYKTRVLVLCGKINEALENQEVVIQRIERESIEHGFWLNELSLLIQLYVDVKDSEAAGKLAIQLRSFETESEQDSKLRDKLFVRNAIVIADEFWRYPLSVYAQKTIEETNLFDSNWQSIYQYTGAIIAFGTGHYSEALDLISKVIAIPKKERPRFTWQPYFLRMLLKGELGEDVEPTYRAAKRMTDRQGHAFPKMLLRIAKRVHKAPFSISKMKFEQWRKEIESLLDDPQELACSHFFDARLWLRSLELGQSMSDASFSDLGETESQAFNSVGFI